MMLFFVDEIPPLFALEPCLCSVMLNVKFN